MMLNVHGANAVFVAIELSLNKVPVTKSHYFAVVAYTALYGLWATFEHLVIYGTQRDWPYFFMDIDHLGGTVAIWYTCLLLIQGAFWMLLLKIDQSKRRYVERFIAAGNEELMADGGGAGGGEGVYEPPVVEADVEKS